MNIGPQYQAEIPKFIGKYDCMEYMASEASLGAWGKATLLGHTCVNLSVQHVQGSVTSVFNAVLFTEAVIPSKMKFTQSCHVSGVPLGGNLGFN